MDSIWESSRVLSGKSDIEKASAGKRPAAGKRRQRIAVAGVAIAVALIAWLATRGDDGSTTPESVASNGEAARLVTPGELSEAAATLGQPVYWAGPMEGTKLGLKEVAGGGTQVFYLPPGVGLHGDLSKALTIGSYPLADAKGQLEGFAARPDSIVRQAGDGREVVSSEGAPTSVYFASPGGEVQVEVYDPSPARARSLAMSERVQPAG